MTSVNAQQWSALMQMQLMQMQQIQLQQQQLMPQMQRADDKNENSPEEARTLFIANIDDKKVDEEMLFELFLQAGPIEKLSFPKQRPFCFVTYAHSCSPAYAMHLFQGVKLFGQNIVIKFNGTINAPPLQRRLLPPDWGMGDSTTEKFNPFNDSFQPQRRSFDNSSLRNSRLAAFMDDANVGENDRNIRRDRSPNRYSRDRGNNDNRRHDRSPTRRHQDSNSDRNWTHGPDRRSRSHHSSGPYDRRGF